MRVTTMTTVGADVATGTDPAQELTQYSGAPVPDTPQTPASPATPAASAARC